MHPQIFYTTHSLIRSQQRAISKEMITDTIAHGEVVYKQGLRFYVMTERSMRYIHNHQYCDHLKNTVVVLRADNSVVTVYRNSEALKRIKKKPKLLYK